MFNDDIHIIDSDAIPYEDIEKWCVAVDYGTGNSTAYLLMGRTREGIIYIVDEYYFEGRKEAQEHGDFDAQKTDLEYSEDMRQFINDHKSITDLGYRDIEIIVDPAASSFILQLRRLKMRSKRANNDVLAGIRTVASYIGDNRLFISDRCKNLLGEIHVYSWDEKAQARGIDSPQKRFDHACISGDTLVYTTEGYKQIKDLVDTKGEVYTLYKDKKSYFDVRKTKQNAEVIKLIFENDEELILTPDHPVLTRDGWKEAGILTLEDKIVTLDKDIKLKEIREHDNCDVYNMEVEEAHLFAVTKSNIIVHNCDAMRYGVMKLKDKNDISKAAINVSYL